jgi:hypothetical protein
MFGPGAAGAIPTAVAAMIVPSATPPMIVP